SPRYHFFLSFVFLSCPTSTFTLPQKVLFLETRSSRGQSMNLEFDNRALITDSLTGVHNLRYLDKVLSWEVARADRWQLPLIMLMLDIDGFKRVNDMHGHVVGNTVLKSLAAILRSSVRPQDFVFRSGDDEFCVVLPGAHLNGGLQVRERILSRIENLDLPTGLSGKVTATVAVCQYK